MLAEQERNLEETKKAIREQVEQAMIHGYTDPYTDTESIPYHPVTNHMSLPGSANYAVITEMEGQQWRPYMQVKNL
jgi:septin family protein